MNQGNPTLQAYAEMQYAFDYYNEQLFDGKLPQCLITFQRERRTHGFFCGQRFVNRNDHSTTDEIAMNPTFFGITPLSEIMQTLVHEMTHAWQHHFGNPGRGNYHNREWGEKMESLGLMPSRTGKEGGAKTGGYMLEYAIAGGKFSQVTQALLSSGFQVSWLDRYPPVIPADVADDEVGEADPAPAAAQAEEITASAGYKQLLIPPSPPRKSNRVRYRCPTCQSQVWGQPDLKIMCAQPDCISSLYEPIL